MIESEAIESLAAWRTDSRIEVAVLAEQVWLRTESDEAGQLMVHWPGLVFRENEGLLYELASPLAKMRLPDGLEWQPLHAWWGVRVAGGLMPSPVDMKVVPKLVRTETGGAASAMRSHIDQLHQYAKQVVFARLEPFRFACAADGSVWIEGGKLMPIEGEAYVIHQNIAIPVGYGWSPALGAQELAKALGIAQSVRAVFTTAGRWDLIPEESMIPMSRSSVKATHESYYEAEMK